MNTLLSGGLTILVSTIAFLALIVIAKSWLHALSQATRSTTMRDFSILFSLVGVALLFLVLHPLSSTDLLDGALVEIFGAMATLYVVATYEYNSDFSTKETHTELLAELRELREEIKELRENGTTS